MILKIVLLSLSCFSLADRQVPPYPDKCPPINALTDYDERKFQGIWYEVASTSNVPYTCLSGNISLIGDQLFREFAKAKIFNGDLYSGEDFFQTVRSPNSPAKVMDVFEGYIYRMVLYIFEVTKELLIGYECREIDELIEESIHVFSRSLDYNKNHLQDVLKEHNLSRMEIRDAFLDCPPELLNP